MRSCAWRALRRRAARRRVSGKWSRSSRTCSKPRACWLRTRRRGGPCARCSSDPDERRRGKRGAVGQDMLCGLRGLESGAPVVGRSFGRSAPWALSLVVGGLEVGRGRCVVTWRCSSRKRYYGLLRVCVCGAGYTGASLREGIGLPFYFGFGVVGCPFLLLLLFTLCHWAGLCTPVACLIS